MQDVSIGYSQYTVVVDLSVVSENITHCVVIPDLTGGYSEKLNSCPTSPNSLTFSK
jgi:hypothetical protein